MPPRSALFESIPKQEPSFLDKITQDLESLTQKQALALPFTGTAGLASGIVKGATFGLVDLNDPLEDLLGDFAPPETLSNAISVAGEIGGSFVPFIGASKIAGGIYKGIDLGSRLAKGAITFGGPEIARQAIQDDVDALGAVRSAATGAVWSLPISRALLAPAVAGTELVLGAPPEEAAIAGGLAGVLGSLGGRKKPSTEIDLKKVGLFLPPGPERKLLGPGRIIRAQPPPTPQTTVEWVRETPPKASPRLQKLAEQRATGKPLGRERIRFFRDPLLPPQEQVDLVRLAATRAPEGPSKAGLVDLAGKIERMSKLSDLQLQSAYNASKAQLGVDDPATKAIRIALGQRTGTYAEFESTAPNLLQGKVPQGPALSQPGPGAHYEHLSSVSNKARKMQESIDPNIIHQSAEIQELIGEFNQARIRGKPLDSILARLKTVQDAPPASEVQDYLIADRIMRKVIKHSPLDKAENYLDDWESNFSRVVDRDSLRRNVGLMREGKRKRVAEVAPATAAFEQAARAEGLVNSPEMEHLVTRVSNHGGALMFNKNRTRKRIEQGRDKGLRRDEEDIHILVNEKKIQYTDKAGKLKSSWRNKKQLSEWLDGLKEGKFDPEDIGQTRLLAYAKGITLFFTGTSLILTNNITGETIDGIGSLKEAVELVRRAPDIADKVRDIGPRIPGLPPLPGVGGIGGLHTEQAPPFAPMMLEEQ